MTGFILLFALIAFPAEALKGAATGLDICIKAVVPSLLPFMLLSSVAVRSGSGEKLGKLLSALLPSLDKSICICFITGLLGGYPCGAKSVGEMVRQGCISQRDGEKALAFCNNSGPLFIVGTVGTALYSDARVGFMLYFCHVAGALAAAAVFGRGLGKGARNFSPAAKAPLFSLAAKSAKESGEAVLSICALIITFSALTQSLGLYRLPFLVGLFEVSRGAEELVPFGIKALPLLGAYISWGGLCVHFQTEAVTEGLSKKYYYKGKLLSAAVSFAFVWILTKFMFGA